MRLIMIAAGLMLLAGSALAQDARGAGQTGGAPAGTAAATPRPDPNAIRPGSKIQPHGQNGMGGDYPVPGLYRSNPGNGLYGATVGNYEGQL